MRSIAFAGVTYTIDERNAERQRLLGIILEPLTGPVLERVPKVGVRRVLDLGCGQGNTSRLLAERFPEAEVLGIEFDGRLVEVARAGANGARVRFEQGDATGLPFADGAFDLVFARYLLLHVPEPDVVVREMLRVTRVGGSAVSFEMDSSLDICEPANPAVATMVRVFRGLFPHPFVGRELVRRFRAAGVAGLEAGACLGMEYEGDIYRRHYTLAAEAMVPAAKAKGLLNDEQIAVLWKQLKELEAADGTMTVKPPDFWVIARR